ncbi:ATP-binding cassette domain-containing protein [Candidatus Korarchaeum cryptofilum]|uniref:ATP-binding cassette domain-containing protein n=1 Tax=Candidatus Korarchaeum cryptofilum TaxID=498846 RepID=A0A3R9RJA7_9CREN|nr:oligopeptide/dipeptide ABC transporter ATP-binding protein [Candidatus Korarchaeum cryptofilum]RSN69928.1 ATP-binding cassette domain-containing protein [Candidatus Korarchaeum cryptofilum]
MLRLQDIKKYFPVRGGVLMKVIGEIKAVDGVSMDIGEGETFGLVGESGSGKTTLGRVVLKLIEPTSGRIFFDGRDITELRGKELLPLRREMQIVFQDPYKALHPKKKVKDIVGEPLIIHEGLRGKEVEERVSEMLKLVGLNPEHMHRYPHEFSGGQRQRIVIARALILRPKFIVLDEPTSALDVSVQAKILNLLSDLKEKFGLTYLLISHNLAVVRHFSNRVGVMYLGKLVEVAPTEELFENPRHPYTIGLISSIPVPDPKLVKSRRKLLLLGEIPSPMNPPSGCRFHTRCPYAKEVCRTEEPKIEEISEGHYVACHLWRELS